MRLGVPTACQVGSAIVLPKKKKKMEKKKLRSSVKAVSHLP
jgi:hypothetical protein